MTKERVIEIIQKILDQMPVDEANKALVTAGVTMAELKELSRATDAQQELVEETFIENYQ